MSTSAATEASAPGSLTEWLRSRTDEQLAELLRRRPDLALPTPADLAQLASRLSVRTSVQRAVDSLDAFALHVLEALVLSGPGPVDIAEASALLGDVAPDDLAAALDALQTLGLVWGDRSALHLVATVRDTLGNYPAGLGRPAATLFAQTSDVQLANVLRSLGLPPAGNPRGGAAVAEALSEPKRMAALLDQSDDEERDILEKLAAGPPLGTVRNANLLMATPAADAGPAHRLIARGLLVAIDPQTVELPREVGLAVRGSAFGALHAEAPPLAVVERSPADLDQLGATAVYEALRLVATLGDAWTMQPPPMLRAGGVGVRELRRTARDLGVDEGTAAVLIEVAHAAGLVGPTTGVEPVYLPTTEFDQWLRRTPAERWAELALAWLAMTRLPSLVNQRGERDRLVTVLGPDVDRGTAPTLRGNALDVLLTLAPGHAPAQRGDVLARLAWQAPRRSSPQRMAVEAILAEADLLGLTAAGGLTGYGRTLLLGSRAAAERALADVLPAPVDHFVVQPDLTVVVPGPPTAELAAELSLAADLESSGGASVYRVSESSIRRALDAGRSGTELAAMFMQRSRTPIPQAMTYLIDDVARRHGVLRVGAASAYLRCEDEALLSRVLAERTLASIGLRRLAPTIVVTATPVTKALEALRAAGYAPAAESPDGMVITLGGDAPRAPSRAGVRTIRPRGAVENNAQLADIVRRIRAGDTITELSRHVQPLAQQVPGVTSASTMALLRQAIREGRRVLLGSVEADGTATRHTILPISLAAGFVRGHDSDSQRLLSFPLHRLTAVSIIADDEDDLGPA